MIENFRAHPYTRAVCLETARLFEGQAAKDLVEAQCSSDEGALNRAQELQAKARLAQQRANAWHLRARNASDQTTELCNALNATQSDYFVERAGRSASST